VVHPGLFRRMVSIMAFNAEVLFSVNQGVRVHHSSHAFSLGKEEQRYGTVIKRPRRLENEHLAAAYIFTQPCSSNPGNQSRRNN
jgi:hypothetical protein